MLDENIWLQLNENDKFSELEYCLSEILLIEKGKHPLSNTKEKGKLALIKRELSEKVFKIIELENAT